MNNRLLIGGFMLIMGVFSIIKNFDFVWLLLIGAGILMIYRGLKHQKKG